MTATNHDLPGPDYAGHNKANSEEQPHSTRHSLPPGIDHFGLNRFAVFGNAMPKE
jgi:hypothetical protein